MSDRCHEAYGGVDTCSPGKSHTHRCSKGHTWCHSDDTQHLYGVENDKAHTCPTCKEVVRQKWAWNIGSCKGCPNQLSAVETIENIVTVDDLLEVL